MLFHNTVHGRQPESRSFTNLLSGKKGLEDPIQCRCVHPRPCIYYAEPDISACAAVRMCTDKLFTYFYVCGLYCESSALRHCIPSIPDKIHEHLLQLRRICPSHFQVSCKPRMEHDVLAESGLQQFESPRDDVI